MATGPGPSHTYTDTGSFTVKLTVTDGVGCTGTISKPSFIRITAPTLALVNPNLGGCVGAGVTPVAIVNSIDGVAGYLWNSGGGNPATSTLANPTFIYPAQADYNITLTVTTNDGCTVTTVFTNAVAVGVPTVPEFTATPSDACASSAITFNSTSAPVDQWIWDFGHGDSSLSAPPVNFVFRDTGNRAVALTVVNHGCAQSLTQTIVHIKPPIARFNYQVDCTKKLIVNFIDSTIVDPSLGATYIWDFKDGSPTVTITGPPGAPPPHTFPAPGTYPVTLSVTNGGCSSTYSLNLVLVPQIADLSVNPTSPCRNTPFTVSAIGSDPAAIASYSWKIGSLPFTPAGRDYTTNLRDTGLYAIDLIIVDNNGCSDTASTHHPYSLLVTGPYANYSPVGIGGCKNSPIKFLDQSTPYPGYPLVRWAWNFGDGGSDIVQNPTHTYIDTAFYLTQLTVQDSKGCADTHRDPTLVQITAPKAGFFAKDTLYCPNLPLPFTDSSKGDGLSWVWDFGDGSATSNIPSPSHPFATNGSLYTIKLKVTDSVGCADSMTRVNYIHIQTPIAAFTIADTTAICPPLQTSFTPNGQYYDSLYWDFGDGTTSTLPVTTHFYNTYDTFTAKLILRGAGGCLDSASRRVFVINPVAVTSFTYSPVRSCDSVLTNFTIIPPGYTKFSLQFGDGKSDSSGNANPSHLYKLPATYPPELVLQDSTGCIVTIPGNPSVVVLGAVPFFTIDKPALCDSGTVSFSDFIITNDKPITETYNFGDGNSTNTPNPAHHYTSPGNWLVTLTVNTANNCMETFTDTVRVYQTPHPVFTVTNSFCATAPLQFLGNITDPQVDSIIWDWNFGDGQGSPLQNPLIIYPQPGQYTVSLKTSVVLGCSDTVSQSVIVHSLPTIKGPATITTPLGFPVTIPFIYGNDIVSYSWTPTANLSCTDCPDPIANPIFKTEYTVIIADSNNCMNTDSILVSTICNGKNYFLPNTFSPNGDGVNDAFFPRGTSIYNIQSMKVFNRWGQKVFERRDFPANSPSDGWDGTFNNHPAPVDVYVYIVEVVCENAQVIALNGNVTLVR